LLPEFIFFSVHSKWSTGRSPITCSSFFTGCVCKNLGYLACTPVTCCISAVFI